VTLDRSNVTIESTRFVLALFTPPIVKILAYKVPLTAIPDFLHRWREEKAMEASKITLITSIAAFLIGTASAAPRLPLGGKVVNSDSAFKSRNARMSAVGFPSARVDPPHGNPDAPAGYSPLGIAKSNGRRIAVYVFQNGAKLDDVAGQGQGFADVFDRAGHLIRHFTFRENLNSPPQITEFVYMPKR
jgi:hypothetical protein